MLATLHRNNGPARVLNQLHDLDLPPRSPSPSSIHPQHRVTKTDRPSPAEPSRKRSGGIGELHQRPHPTRLRPRHRRGAGAGRHPAPRPASSSARAPGPPARPAPQPRRRPPGTFATATHDRVVQTSTFEHNLVSKITSMAQAPVSGGPRASLSAIEGPTAQRGRARRPKARRPSPPSSGHGYRCGSRRFEASSLPGGGRRRRPRSWIFRNVSPFRVPAPGTSIEAASTGQPSTHRGPAPGSTWQACSARLHRGEHPDSYCGIDLEVVHDA